MHVRKFQGETIEETLKEIKVELGPDAIILKTTTNRGIKGAFKRNRVEVTAAISEKTYLKKASLENSVGKEITESLKEQPASYLSELIDHHDERVGISQPKNNKKVNASGYGQLGLNKKVNKVDLDAFLSDKKEQEMIPSSVNEFINMDQEELREQTTVVDEIEIESEEATKQKVNSLNLENLKNFRVDIEEMNSLKSEIQGLKEIVNELTQREVEFRASERYENSSYIQSIYNLLKSSGLNDRFLQDGIKDFLSQKENATEDELIDFILLKIKEGVSFNKDSSDTPGVKLFIGTKDSGNSSLVKKVLSKSSCGEVITFREEEQTFTSKVSGIKYHYVNSQAEAISMARKIVKEGKTAYVELRLEETDPEELSSIYDFFKNNFEIFRTQLTLNSLHSENINLRTIRKYHKFIDSISFTHCEHCLDWGSIFNCGYLTSIPFNYFSFGVNIQDSLEELNEEKLIDQILG